MDKKRMIPLLSTLVLSAALVANKTYAEEVTPVMPEEPIASATTEQVATEESQVTESSNQTSEIETEMTSSDSEESSQEVADTTEPVSESPEMMTTSLDETAQEEMMATTATSEPTQDVTILHTNDMHGNMEEGRGVLGMAKLAAVVEEYREQGPTLLLDGGDALQGMPITNSTQGEEMVALMNQIGYDAMTVGNHEFDFGLDQLKRFKELLTFPIISANIYVDGVRLMQPYTIVDKDETVAGDEFVVIALTTPEATTKTHPRNIPGVTFTEPIAEVEKVIAEVEARAQAEGKEYKNYVVLSHLGIDQTTLEQWQGGKLAEAFSQSKLLEGKRLIVVDGHSHTLATANYGDNVVYGQTGNYLNNIGKITISPDKMTATSLSYNDLKDTVPHVAVADKVAQVKADFEKLNSEVIVANNPVELDADRMNVRVRETNIGNLITDAMLEYGQTGFSNKTNLAVMNGGGIRKTLEKDKPITKGGVIAVLPFGNFISQIEMTGQEIEAMFIKSLGSVLQTNAETKESVLDENGQPLLEPNGGFLHVSGALVYYDTTQDAVKRILAISIYNPETDEYEPLEMTKRYYLATNDFLAAGGDGYTMLGGSREEGPSLDTVFADYLSTYADVIDWSAYEAINPNERLVSISTADFMALLEEAEEVETVEVETNKDQAPVSEQVPDVKVEQEKATTSAPVVTEQPTTSSQMTASSTSPVANSSMAPKSMVVTKVASPVAKPSQEHQTDKMLPMTASPSSLISVVTGFGLMLFGLLGVRTKKED
ncbi:5'-nucleotidase C-terminal domain-containing protein [Streptococcus sp. sy010]|uniref:5'-nucleotidase C-terminal domain-containing protein n=1 Tax=Streptococcus sp. sy010 TaxID=2600148 RepID=UPI0011B3BDB9|nr:5'-nucleotidase C-terminal domain-containing protein [Streptococcus sp. sy010]TWT16524.1 bifunctional metallophosphatase/5'-nucleotidase [Streptococcus sp. sy010]